MNEQQLLLFDLGALPDAYQGFLSLFPSPPCIVCVSFYLKLSPKVCFRSVRRYYLWASFHFSWLTTRWWNAGRGVTVPLLPQTTKQTITPHLGLRGFFCFCPGPAVESRWVVSVIDLEETSSLPAILTIPNQPYLLSFLKCRTVAPRYVPISCHAWARPSYFLSFPTPPYRSRPFPCFLFLFLGPPPCPSHEPSRNG